ncbi:uncharacterized protein LOC132724966 [Ruditapes philippinarum]|uniref:uncharacterized protein LOC132724966 n=1 Tax=Ruditapes philippinarum TaxID=129788 RepID=UPI00295C1229|nr:uncharacterized protein LOC132724966 [Ruditapes philippinarum]
MDDDCSSDEDLPVGLTPLKLEKTPSENDIVWVKWKKWPHLPALVRKVYKKKKRVTCAVFFPTGFEEDFTLSYGNQGAVIPYCDPKKDEILESAKDLSSVDRTFFRACLAEAQNYMTKEALKGLRKPEPLKENITQEEEPEDIKDDNCEEENEEKITPCRKRRKMSDCIVTKVENNGLSKQGQERVEKRKLKTRPLIDFLISDTTKDFLEKIFNGTTKSELHDKFLTGTIRERAKMKHRGFGPIDDDEQIELLLSTYLTWIKQINKNIHLDDVNYVFDVWVPEAVVFAFKKVNGYSRKRAWERFDIGKYRLKRFECKEIDGKGVRFIVSRRETHQNQ